MAKRLGKPTLLNHIVTLVLLRHSGATNWKLISEKLYELNPKKKIFRTPKQCREHWSCYLDPKIKKGPW